MNKFLTQAVKFHRKALTEFAAARRNGMEETDIIQAAEKGWLAAHRATNALLDRFGRKASAGTNRKESDLIDLERRYPEIRKAEIKARFANFHWRLHVSAGYEGFVSVKIVERDIRAVGEYIDTIRRLISR